MIVIVLLIAFYLFLLMLLYSFGKQGAAQNPEVQELCEISVVVCARNEQHNLAALLSSLEAQDYPMDNFELLVVDDHSQDKTIPLLEQLQEKSPLTIRILKNKGQGKKEAMALGVEMANGQLIATTDADCLLPASWLTQINTTFTNQKKLEILFGPVRYRGKGSIAVFQKLETLVLMFVTNVFFKFNRPAMSNGANMAFTKAFFFQAQHNRTDDALASGDDHFLMLQASKNGADTLQFKYEPSFVVDTRPAKTLAEFINQKIRWASKWQFQNSNSARWAPIGMFTLYCAFLFSFYNWPIGLGLLVLKTIVESIFVRRAARNLKTQVSLFSVIGFSLVYPLYGIIVAILSHKGSYQWKGRRLPTPFRRWTKKLKPLSAMVGIVLTLFLFVHHALVFYGFVQLKGQLTIVLHAKPVAEYKKDASFPDSLKVKLEVVEAVKQFVVDSLGYTASDHYTTMYDQKGEPLMWVVSGAEPYSMRPYLWHFPILGAVPYKGFFQKEMAKQELERLKEQGYDYSVRNPGAWSTLGYLPEPLLSEMLNREVGQLADVIIHELTHTMVFVKDSIEFNENLASFIAYHGTVRFLRAHYGANSEELKEYIGQEADFEKFANHFLNGAQYLEKVYASFEDTSTIAFKSESKAKAIQTIVSSLDTVSFYNKAYFTGYFEKQKPNNTYFMSFMRYRSKFETFDSLYKNKFDGDLLAFLDYYKTHYPSL